MARLLPSRLPAKPTALIGLGAAALATTIALPPTPWLVWNASASAPIGLYAVSGRQDIASGDMVLVRVPDRWRRLAAERRYIPINIPLVKRVAAAPGDRVCARGREIYDDILHIDLVIVHALGRDAAIMGADGRVRHAVPLSRSRFRIVCSAYTMLGTKKGGHEAPHFPVFNRLDLLPT